MPLGSATDSNLSFEIAFGSAPKDSRALLKVPASLNCTLCDKCVCKCSTEGQTNTPTRWRKEYKKNNGDNTERQTDTQSNVQCANRLSRQHTAPGNCSSVVCVCGRVWFSVYAFCMLLRWCVRLCVRLCVPVRLCVCLSASASPPVCPSARLSPPVCGSRAIRRIMRSLYCRCVCCSPPRFYPGRPPYSARAALAEPKLGCSVFSFRF